jgi:hypothetical protein
VVKKVMILIARSKELTKKRTKMKKKYESFFSGKTKGPLASGVGVMQAGRVMPRTR